MFVTHASTEGKGRFILPVTVTGCAVGRALLFLEYRGLDEQSSGAPSGCHTGWVAVTGFISAEQVTPVMPVWVTVAEMGTATANSEST